MGVDLNYDYMRDLVRSLMSLESVPIDKMVTLLQKGKTEGRTAYICGNGGSAANASHLALHLNQAGLKAICLSDNVPMITALANDIDYDQVFSAQVRWADMTKTLLVVVSGSGNSLNILRVIDAWCGEIIGLLGMDGGQTLKRLQDRQGSTYIVVPSMAYGPIEDAHSALIHILAERLKMVT